MDRSLVDGAIAHEDKTAALEPHVFDGVGEAGAEGGLATDDAVAAPVVLVGREIMHRATLALRAARHAAGQLGHALVHTHADHQAVAVVAVASDDMVMFTQKGDRAGGDGFLADIEVEEAANLALLVDSDAALFEMADSGHFGVKRDLIGLGHGRIGRIFGVFRRAGEALQGFRMSKDGGLGHGGSFGLIGGVWPGRSSVPLPWVQFALTRLAASLPFPLSCVRLRNPFIWKKPTRL